MSTPEDPISKAFQGAIAVHEFYAGLCLAGFNEAQALYLTGQFIQAGVQAGVHSA